MKKQLIYREHETVAANLEVVAGQNKRNVSDELRAATSVYLGLVNLAHIRITSPKPGMEQLIRKVEHNTKDEIGRVLMAGLHADVVSAFENAAGVDYPEDHFGRIHVPFDRLLDWIVTGKP